MSDGRAQHGDWRDERAQRAATEKATEAEGLTDPPRPGETFQDFQVRQLRAQSLAAEATARSAETIKNILVVWAILMAIGFVFILIRGLA